MSLALLIMLPQLIAAGISTVQEVQALIKTFQPGMTDAELNAVLSAITTSAQKHLALANADAGKP